MANPEHLDVVRQGAEAIRQWKEQNPSKRLDLLEADQRVANLYGADLSRANLIQTNLIRAVLYGANLHRAVLYGADLYGADLRRANLYGARLEGAYLVAARLEGAYLVAARLEGANLDEAHLEGATLSWTQGLTPEQAQAARDAGARVDPSEDPKDLSTPSTEPASESELSPPAPEAP